MALFEWVMPLQFAHINNKIINKISFKKIFRISYPRALNQILNEVKKVKPGFDPKSLSIKPWSYWQAFMVDLL